MRGLIIVLCAVLCAAPAWGARRAAHRSPAAGRGPDYAKSLVPGYPDVVGEYLQIPGSPSDGTPPALATATFLRLRSAADGETPKAANAVVVAMPGFSSTPAHWLYLAAQLVHKAAARTCAGGPCRLEVWIVQRRGANLADTAGGRLARAQHTPVVALDYYFDRGVVSADPDRPGRFPTASPKSLVGIGGGKWRPLEQADLPFLADWGFETYAGDVDAMIGLIRQAGGGRNIFLAGHSQGGGFVSLYAGRLQAGGKRGYQRLAGLIFLDGGPSAGGEAPPSDADLKTYLDHVQALRAGAPVFTDATGPLGDIAGPAAAAASAVSGAYYALSDPNAESIFGPRSVGASAVSPSGDAFLREIHLTYLARAGMTFDTDPVPSAGLQIPFLSALGEGLGHLDFKPRPGTEGQCDVYKPAPPPGAPSFAAAIAPVTCVPTPVMLDSAKVYGWSEGGAGSATDVGRAMLWLQSQGYAPSRSNIGPVTLKTASGSPVVLDAGNLVASNWYPSERYDFDMQTLDRYRTLAIHAGGADLDIDRGAIAAIPVYVARQSPAAKADNPFPLVTDYTEINRTGTYQTGQARALTPIDPAINVALYHHTDFVSADDSLEGRARPGEPGASAIADTLIDWVLKRSAGRAAVPTPKSLGVRDTY